MRSCVRPANLAFSRIFCMYVVHLHTYNGVAKHKRASSLQVKNYSQVNARDMHETRKLAIPGGYLRIPALIRLRILLVCRDRLLRPAHNIVLETDKCTQDVPQLGRP